jgi:hypothetical protein
MVFDRSTGNTVESDVQDLAVVVDYLADAFLTLGANVDAGKGTFNEPGLVTRHELIEVKRLSADFNLSRGELSDGGRVGSGRLHDEVTLAGLFDAKVLGFVFKDINERLSYLKERAGRQSH